MLYKSSRILYNPKAYNIDIALTKIARHTITTRRVQLALRAQLALEPCRALRQLAAGLGPPPPRCTARPAW